MDTIGILGAGQLGSMLAQAALPLDIRCRFLDPSPTSVAAAVGDCISADYSDNQAQDTFLADCQVVTWEFENVSLSAVQAMAKRAVVHPDPKVLAVKQDRLDEKKFLQSLGIETAPYAEVSSRQQLTDAIARIGLPAVLKTRRDGYDGKGQMVLRQAADADVAWAALSKYPLILEGFIQFTRECSLIAARGADGAIAYWPLVENEHRQGILHRSLAPAPHAWVVQEQAQGVMRTLMEALDYVGVLTIEFFQHDGRLLTNEFAPRVHNSGHWTIEGSVTSQFANHIRAVAGLPLGVTASRGHAVMINLIGAVPDRAALLAIPGVSLHLYGKEPRTGRKLGHVTIVHDDARKLSQLAAAVEALVVAAAPERAL